MPDRGFDHKKMEDSYNDQQMIFIVVPHLV